MNGLSINQKLHIKAGSTGERYISRIQEIKGNQFSITIPSNASGELLLASGQEVHVEVFVENGRLIFETRVTGRKRDNVPLITLALPVTVKRVQLRNFVRMPLTMEVPYLPIGPEELNMLDKLNLSQRGIAMDISGGGIRLSTSTLLAVDQLVALRLTLAEGRINRFLTVAGCVRRVEERELNGHRMYAAGIEYHLLQERERDLIIGFVFRKMRQKVKDG